MHPAEELRGKKTNKLLNKRIVLGITGSIAAVECVKLARELIRHGAIVYPVMTPSATRIIHPDAMEFATGHKPVVQLSGQTEHVSWCGLVQDPVDLLLISPCTANTISKIARGIDDTPVTTCATTAIGSGVPILLVPAMHLSMYDHKIVQQNIEICKKHGVLFIDPFISGNKAKSPEILEIVETVIRTIGRKDLLNEKILIIGGATAEPLDDIRVLTNRSSGKTAVALSISAFERGADVELWYGYASQPIPSFIKCKRFETVKDLLFLVKKNLIQFDDIIVCAAIANYIPKKQTGKIPSGKPTLSIDWSQAPVVLESLRRQFIKTKIIAFKTEEKKQNVRRRTRELLTKYHLDGAIGNTLDGFGGEVNEILLLTKKGKGVWKKGKKEELASDILDLLS
ncbi:MAG: bifunctional phosphopantothenoylcysteine decarboxylase/phosphopantothenate--cysteine ligase CoaBC [Candidatus Thermoplasmatota archaeon]|jgi:phosphopantothenoylcysteine decarboxylase/phosphopantothenate--cysteine ligase|nr:bifunctional phosphopantothenoylcysteine decarboxylase/phosphopantothenate--cysteine ligase CoaBC [Candidatus Thermoplasmatota archaeon]